MDTPPIKKARPSGRVFKIFRTLVILGVLGLAALLVSFLVERRMEITLPAPTGQFAVGRAIYDWTDEAGLDTLAPTPGTKRELLVWIWYPAAAGQSGAMADYLPAEMRAAAEPGGLFKLLTRDLSKVHGHSLRDSNVSPQQGTYPVVIMRAGASSEVWNYSTLAEDLASNGYVVVGFDAPYRTFEVVFPDGRVIRRTPENNPELCDGLDQVQQASCVNREMSAWIGDTGFVLDRLQKLNNSDPSGKFTGRLDMARVGVFGHSFGGATALQFCHDDSRCKAAIDVDGQPFGIVVREGLRQPAMFLLGEHKDESGAETSKIATNIQSIYDHLPPDERLRVSIRGAYHFGFSDDGALLKSHIVMRALRMFGIIGIDGRRQLAVTAYCVHSFFDAYLKETGNSRLDISSPLYPEIEALK
jgi:predicted dienelactone hydrolase